MWRIRLRAPGTTVRRARARHEQAPHDGDCHWAPKDAASQWNHTEDGGKCREQHRPRKSGNSASIADGLILRQHLSGMQRQNRWDPANSRRILSREIVIGPLYTKTSKRTAALDVEVGVLFRSLRRGWDPLNLEILEKAFDATWDAVEGNDLCCRL